MTTQIIEFSRPNKSVPWGFSIQGGKEFGCPLSVLKVTPGSIANRLGVIAGDFLIKINEQCTDVMTHQQAIIQIQNLKVMLEIKRSKDMIDNQSFPPPPVIDSGNFNNSCRISTSIGELPPPPPELSYVKPPTSSFVPSKPLIKESPTPVISKPKETYQERVSVPSNRFNQSGDNKSKSFPPIILDTKKVELFQQQVGENNNRPSETSSTLGKLLQNQINQPRDSKNLPVQQPKHVSGSSICFICKNNVQGAYIEANNKVYCKNHFCCSFCGQPIKGNQFMETKEGLLYCMEDFTNNIAPKCAKCNSSVVEEQTVALGKCWHTRCFLCDHCKTPIAQGTFHIRDDNGRTLVYCERDYKAHYEIKCSACNFPIDDDDQYLLVSGKNYHTNCFK